MAIYQLIQTASFSPEDVTRLTAAYEDALRKLQLSNRTDPITTIIAQRNHRGYQDRHTRLGPTLRLCNQGSQGSIGEYRLLRLIDFLGTNCRLIQLSFEGRKHDLRPRGNRHRSAELHKLPPWEAAIRSAMQI